jgi:hypothetical protein
LKILQAWFEVKFNLQAWFEVEIDNLQAWFEVWTSIKLLLEIVELVDFIDVSPLLR